MSDYVATHRLRRRRHRSRFSPAGSVTALVALLIAGAGGGARPAAAATSPATVTGVVVEPDGRGARVLVTLTGAFHYLITGAERRVVIGLDPVLARSAVRIPGAGPVQRVTLRPIAGTPPRTRITVVTSEPVGVAGSFLDAGTLVVRLVPTGPRAATGCLSENCSVNPGSPRIRIGSADSWGGRWPGAPDEFECADIDRRASRTPRDDCGGGNDANASSPANSSGWARLPINGVAGAEPRAPASRSGRGSPVGVQAPAPAARIDGGTARTLTLEAGMGRLLDVDGLVRVAVSDPGVLGVVPVSSRQLLITGRGAGRTTLYVWEQAGRLRAYEVNVRPGLDVFARLRRALATLLPAAVITVTDVRGAAAGAPATTAPVLPPSAAAPALPPPAPVPPAAGGFRASMPRAPAYAYPAASPAAGSGHAGVILTGTVETQLDRAKAGDIARAFVPAVVNLLTVRRPVQFSLHVQVVELSRSAQDALGITWGGGQQVPGSAPSLAGGVYNLQLLTSPGISTKGLDLLIAQLAALSQHGQAKLLARPELTVLAGQTASLLLGGQVPIPVAGPNGSVTIEYKDFGVILAARPDYQGDGRLFLRIAPEVSTLDFTDAVKVNGFTIPALRVRRAQTIVAMRPGETLVLGGLLQRDDTELVQKIPFLADLPVIGALFRSRSFQRQESDLVILVTPQLVPPSHAS